MQSLLVIIVGITAAVWDVRTRRIPNWLTFSAIGIGFVLSCFQGIPGIWKWFLGTATGFALMFIPYILIGGIGEGDIKLAAAFGALGGPGFAVWAVAYGAVLGGIGAIWAVFRQVGLKKLATDLKSQAYGIWGGCWSLSSVWREVFIPYAPFLSTGALLVLALKGGTG